MVEQLTPDQPVSGSIPLVLTFLFYLFLTLILYRHTHSYIHTLILYTIWLSYYMTVLYDYTIWLYYMTILYDYTRHISLLLLYRYSDIPIDTNLLLCTHTHTTTYLYVFYHPIYPPSSFSLRALIAQSVEHGANNARVVGSSPTGSIFCLFIFCYVPVSHLTLCFLFYPVI